MFFVFKKDLDFILSFVVLRIKVKYSERELYYIVKKRM